MIATSPNCTCPRPAADCQVPQREEFPDGQRFLDLHELNAEAVVEDLAAEIDQFEIFVLPKQQPAARQKYDYVIRYDDPKLLVYAKMTSPDSDPPVVFLSFHRHNIPGVPLPQIPVQDTDETD